MFRILLGFWTIRACLSDYWPKFSVLKAVAVLPTSPLKFPLLCSIHIWQVNRHYYVLRGKVFSVYLLPRKLTKWQWKVSGKWNVNLSCNVRCLLRFPLGFRTQNCIGEGDWLFPKWVELPSTNHRHCSQCTLGGSYLNQSGVGLRISYWLHLLTFL